MSALIDYVDRLDGALVGPRRAKRDLMQEVSDHLSDSAEAHEEQGHDRTHAEDLAVTDFGEVRVLAPGYQSVLSAGLSRRLGLVLFVVLIAQPLAWGVHESEPAPAQHLLWSLNEVVENLGMGTAGLALVIALANGIGVRYLGVRPRLMRIGCLSALTSSVLICGLGLAMYASAPVHSLGGLAYITAVTLLPFGWVAWSGLRCLSTLDRTAELARS